VIDGGIPIAIHEKKISSVLECFDRENWSEILNKVYRCSQDPLSILQIHLLFYLLKSDDFTTIDRFNIMMRLTSVDANPSVFPKFRKNTLSSILTSSIAVAAYTKMFQQYKETL